MGDLSLIIKPSQHMEIETSSESNSGEMEGKATDDESEEDEETETSITKHLTTDEHEEDGEIETSTRHLTDDESEEDEETETSTTKHLTTDEHEEDEDIEASTVKNLVNDEHGGTADEIVKEAQEQEEDMDIETSSESDSGEMEGKATDITTEDQEEEIASDNSMPSSPIQVSNVDTDIQKEGQEDGDFTKETPFKSTGEEGETLSYVKGKEHSENSSETTIVKDQSVEQMEVEMHYVQEEAKDEDKVLVKTVSTDSSHDSLEVDDEKEGDDVKQQGNIENLVSEEIKGDEEKQEPAYDGSEVPKSESLSNFVRARSLVAVSNVLRRFSGKIDEGQNVEPNKDAHDPLEPITMKGRIILYTKLRCQDCKGARLFLHKKRLRYVEINIDVYPSRKEELEKISGSSDVPKVFFNEVLVGGLNELKILEESGKLKEKIEYVKKEGPPFEAPQPPFSGEDDVSGSGDVDELALIVRKMKESIVVKDRFYKFRRVTNSFIGSEAVDFLSKDQCLEREEAVEFGRKLAKLLFFHHVLDENIFEDGNHLYRFLDQDPEIAQCQNIPRGIINVKPIPLKEISSRLRFLLYAILEAYASEDGRHVDYITIHGSEEFARYLRIAEELQRVDMNKTQKEERLAFFINLYNLMTIHGILVWGHPEGALERRKLLGDFKYVIGGCAYSLSAIHNGILRANQRPPYNLVKPFGVNDRRLKVALPYPEPLIHFALVCGSRSSPPLRCYSAKNVDAELADAARNFLRSGALILHLDEKMASVSKILNWYSVDFGKSEIEVLKHAANYLEHEQSQAFLDLVDSTQLKVVYQPYDWGLNC